MKIEWIDRGRDPQCTPDARYPNGMDIDLSGSWPQTCKADLPYPAKRCGVYIVTCEICGQNIGITTAGRADDPRSIRMACKTRGEA